MRRYFSFIFSSKCLTDNYLTILQVKKLAADNADGVADIKGAIAAIHFIITCAAKYDVTDAVLIQEIQQLGLPKENSDTVAKQYRENKDTLRQVLEERSYRINHYVSTDWRVDQVLAYSTNPSTTTATSSTPQTDTENQYQLTAQKLVHLNVKINHSNDITQVVEGEKNNHNIESLALELSAEQLDLLIHELSQAEKLMDDISS